MTENIKEQVTKELMLCSRFMSHRPGHPRGQEHILRLLKDKEFISQKELQDEMGVRPGSISEIISKMEDRGLVERKRSESDSRAVDLCLTEKGKERLEMMEEPEDLFTAISEEELIALKDILTKLNNDWIRREPMVEHHGPHHHRPHDPHGPRPEGPRGPHMGFRGHGPQDMEEHGPDMDFDKRFPRQ